MSWKSLRFVPLALGAALAACADTPSAPVSDATLRGTRVANLEQTLEIEGFTLPYAVYFKPGRGSAIEREAAAVGATVNFVNDRYGFAMVSGLDETTAGRIRALSGVEGVAVDEMIDMELLDGIEVQDASVASPEAPNTAFFYARQWHLRAIGAEQAWAAGKFGSRGVTVAVLDGGVDYTHPDLAGLVDLSRSVSLLPIENAVLPQVFPGAHPVADLQFHGTHVAATIASNAIAAAGVTSNTTIIGVKVCYGANITSGGVLVARAGSCLGSAILAGVVHAIENNAQVINMSLGGAFLKRGSQGFHSTINRIFNAANRAGITVVVSAGNNGSDLDRHQLPDADGNPVSYPSLFKTYCDAPHVVCVSATGPTAGVTNGPWQNIDALAPYSNYGRSVITVAAPGGAASPVWAACTRFSLAIAGCRTGVSIVGLSGTSMAAPHVSGLAALLYAEGVRQPSQVRNRLMRGADDLGQPGRDPFYGAGRINVPGTLGL